MKRTAPLSLCCIILSLVLSFTSHATDKNSRHTKKKVIAKIAKSNPVANPDVFDENDVVFHFYDSLQLDAYGLSKQAWACALKGYRKLLKRGTLSNPGIITICDFSLSSRKKRLFIIDLKDGELVKNTYVAHGRKSGTEYAKKFSNRNKSHQSSLGFYVTGDTYYGDHGLALRIEGMDRGFNDNARRRNIVVHGSQYVGDDFIQSNSFMGRSFGCPAVPAEETTDIVNTIKNGSCFFIYYPEKKYIAKSKILNG